MATDPLGERTDSDSADAAVDDTLVTLGTTLRTIRQKRGRTLQELANQTGISVSMLSMVERGARPRPSIGSLVALASALDVHMSVLFDPEAGGDTEPVHRLADQSVIETAEGVMRRLAYVDDDQNVEVVVNEYPPGTASAAAPLHHAGHEYGVVLSGVLTVEIDGASYQLRPGDAIGFSSETSHRLSNSGARRVKALWINIGRR